MQLSLPPSDFILENICLPKVIGEHMNSFCCSRVSNSRRRRSSVFLSKYANIRFNGGQSTYMFGEQSIYRIQKKQIRLADGFDNHFWWLYIDCSSLHLFVKLASEGFYSFFPSSLFFCCVICVETQPFSYHFMLISDTCIL